MPVRSLNSAVFKWPSRDEVLVAARQWAGELLRGHPSVERILCVGSCARGDWGVGSDLDIIIVLSDCDLSPVERNAQYEPQDMPVPVDLMIFTRTEWASLRERCPGLYQRLEEEGTDLGDCTSQAEGRVARPLR